MSAELHELYQQAILDHDRHPRNCRAIEGGRRGEGSNPVCGDRITVYVQLEGDVIRDVSFQGSGCAIMKASASLMTASVKGLTRADTDALVERFLRMIATPPGGPVEDLGELTALAGVRWFPIRVKCARLPWHAMRAAANARGDVVSTE
jgi:nitrogen fixation NifU-like protein